MPAAATKPSDKPFADGEDLLLTFGFRCNLACTFCLVEDGLDTLTGVPPATFRQWLTQPERLRGIKRVVLSGGEATLEPDLLEYAQLARQVPGVQHVRIQTNATRLHDRAYLQRLVEAGIDEFFVSVHAADEAVNARITQRKGAFKAIVAGLEAIAASPASLHTNTCMCTDNLHQLRTIVDLVAPLGPKSLSFWNLQLRVDRPETRRLMARVGDIAPALAEALDRCEVLGLPATVKWVPRCLLGRHGGRQDDDQPTTQIEPQFWAAMPQYACLWGNACRHAAQGCHGLQHAYVEEFGWEEDLLRPAPVELAAKAPQGPVQLPLTAAQQAELAQLDRKLGLSDLLAAQDWQLVHAQRVEDALRLTIQRAEVQAWIELAPIVAGRGAFLRTASLQISHSRAEGAAQQALSALLAEVQRCLPPRDPGGLRLPWQA